MYVMKSVFNIVLIVSVVSGNPVPQFDENEIEVGVKLTSTTTSTTKTRGPPPALPAPSFPSDQTSSATSNSNNDDPVGGFFDNVFGFLGRVGERVGGIIQNPNTRKAIGTVIEAGVNATGRVIDFGSSLIGLGNKSQNDGNPDLIRGVLKATNETRPFIKTRINQLQEVGKLFGAFVETLADEMFKDTSQFLTTYDRRVRCHSLCESISDQDKRDSCIESNCKGFNADEFSYEDDQKSQDDQSGIQIKL